MVANEIYNHYPHLAGKIPSIVRKTNTELDVFVQLLIDEALSKSQKRQEITTNIHNILQNERLRPLFHIYSKQLINNRIKETTKTA